MPADDSAESPHARHRAELVQNRYRPGLSRYTARANISGMTDHDAFPIDITIPGSPEDPRDEIPLPEGVRTHRVPSLHPEDVVTLPNGLRVTSVARTLIDLAECLTREELCEVFANARERRLLDMDAVHRARARVEWRPSLAMLDGVIAEFDD
jgi:hypothetical protein